MIPTVRSLTMNPCIGQCGYSMWPHVTFSLYFRIIYLQYSILCIWKDTIHNSILINTIINQYIEIYYTTFYVMYIYYIHTHTHTHTHIDLEFHWNNLIAQRTVNCSSIFQMEDKYDSNPLRPAATASENSAWSKTTPPPPPSMILRAGQLLQVLAKQEISCFLCYF